MTNRGYESRLGIALAEALVMIIIAGSVMVPIMGTLMQSAQMTGNLQHQVLARQAALSMQAKIQGGIPYRGQPANLVDQVITPDGATLTVRVVFVPFQEIGDLRSQVILPEARRPLNVFAWRLEVDRQAGPGIEAASLTFLTGIVYSKDIYEENLFVSSPALGKIAAIHQDTHAVKYLSTTSKPGHLAVHPSNRFLYAQCATGVAVISIDPASTTYLTQIGFLGLSTGMCDTSGDGIREDVGIDIRPDGKYLFCWDEAALKVRALVVSDTSPFLQDSTLRIGINNAGAVFPSNKGTGLRVSQDNILFTSNHSDGFVRWVNVGQPGNVSDWVATWAQALGTYAAGQHPLDVRSDAQAIAVHEHSTNVDLLSATSGAVIAGPLVCTANYPEGLTFTRNSRAVISCDKGNSTKMNYCVNCATIPTSVLQNINSTNNGYFPTVPPNNKNVYWTTFADQVEYLDVGSLTSGLLANPTPSSVALQAGFDCLGIASRRFPMVFVGTSDGLTHGLSVVDGGAHRVAKTLPLTRKPDFLAVNRLGDVAYSGTAGTDDLEKTDLFQTTATWQTPVANVFGGADSICGVAITPNDRLLVAGKATKLYRTTDSGLGAITVGAHQTWSNAKLQAGSQTVVFHRSDTILTSYGPTAASPGGFRIASTTALDFAASKTTELNWPNHPVGAVALSPNDGMLAVFRPDTEEICLYDLGGDWPPKNPTWGRFSVQKFDSDDTSTTGGDIPPYPQPWTGGFDSAITLDRAWFPDGTYDTHALRYFTQYHFGSGSPQWRVYASCDDGNRVAVGTSSLSAPDGFINEAAWQSALYNNIPNSNVPNEPPWSKHGPHDNRTPAFTTLEWGKIWFEWYDNSGGANVKMGLHRDSPSALDVLFDGSGATIPVASFGYNLFSPPKRVLPAGIPVLAAGPAVAGNRLEMVFSSNGEWLFVLDRSMESVYAIHLLWRTSATPILTWAIPAADTPTYDPIGLCLSPEGSTLWVAAAGPADGKVYALDVADDSTAAFMQEKLPVVKLTQPATSINAPQVSTYINRHRCRKIQDLPQTVWGAQAVSFQNRIYVIGGFTTAGNYTALTNVWVFDPLTNAFDAGKTLAAPFGQGAACVLDDMILTFGGINGGTSGFHVNKTQRFWPAGGDANFVDVSRDYNNILSGGARWITMATLNGYAYAFGGKNSGNTAYTSDIGSIAHPNSAPSISGWVKVKSGAFPSTRMGGSSVRCGDLLYYMGGWDGAIKTDTYAYDPSSNSVTAKDALNQGRTGFATCQYQGKIYVFGGTSDANTTGAEALSSVECYDPATNSWTTLPPLPKSIYYLTGAQIGGKMYLFGGINSSGNAIKDIYEYDL